jgi:hypothetical protein
VNLMPESTWEILGKPAMIPSLGRIGLFKGKMITLCGRVTNVPMISHGTSTEEEFEVIKFVENNTPFALLLGKTWIEKDQIRRKEEEEATEQKKKELRDFMARRIELNRRTRGQVEATEGQRLSCRSCKNAGRLENPIHAGEKSTYPRSSKRRGITFEPFGRPSTV